MATQKTALNPYGDEPLDFDNPYGDEPITVTSGERKPERKLSQTAEDIIATGISAVSPSFPKPFVKAVLFSGREKTKVPLLGDINLVDTGLRTLTPIAGSIFGKAGGAAGGLAGESLAQLREIARGERQDVSEGRLASATILGGVIPGKLAPTTGVVRGAAVRGAQAGGLGAGAVTTETLLDEGRLPTIGELATAAGGASIFGTIFGGLEKGVPKLWNAIKGKQPADAKPIIEKSTDIDDATKTELVDALAGKIKTLERPEPTGKPAPIGEAEISLDLGEAGLAARKSAEVFETSPNVASDFNQRIIRQMDVLKKFGVPVNKESRAAARDLAEVQSKPDEYNALLNTYKKYFLPKGETATKAAPLKSLEAIPDDVAVPPLRETSELAALTEQTAKAQPMPEGIESAGKLFVPQGMTLNQVEKMHSRIRAIDKEILQWTGESKTAAAKREALALERLEIQAKLGRDDAADAIGTFLTQKSVHEESPDLNKVVMDAVMKRGVKPAGEFATEAKRLSEYGVPKNKINKNGKTLGELGETFMEAMEEAGLPVRRGPDGSPTPFTEGEVQDMIQQAFSSGARKAPEVSVIEMPLLKRTRDGGVLSDDKSHVLYSPSGIGANLLGGKGIEGKISPKLLGTLAGAGSGGTAGAAYGWEASEGKPIEDRLKQTLALGGAGTLLGGVMGRQGGKLLERGYVLKPKAQSRADLLREVKDVATGGEGMPEWYKQLRTDYRQMPLYQDIVKGARDVEAKVSQIPGGKASVSAAKGVGGFLGEVSGLSKITPKTLPAIREGMRSNFTRVKDLTERVAKQLGDLPDEANPYMGATLYKNRAGAVANAAIDKLQQYDMGITAMAKAHNMEPEAFRIMLQQYQRAKYAPSANRRLRERALENNEPYQGSGMDDAQAAQVIADAEKAGLTTDFELLSQGYQDLVDLSRRAMLESGLISQKTYDKWSTEYKDYVPHKRVTEDLDPSDAIEVLGAGPGANVSGPGWKQMKGSEADVIDLNQGLLENLADSIRRSERNKYGNKVLNFIRMADKDGVELPGMRIHEPKFGESFDKNRMLAVFDKGKKLWVEFDDPVLAQAFGDINTEQLAFMIRKVQSVTNTLGGLYTRYNPNFLLKNMIRDAADVAEAAASRGDVVGAMKQLTPSFKNSRGVWDWAFLDGQSPEAQLYDRMVKAGGIMEGFGLSTKADVQKKIADIYKHSENGFVRSKDRIIEFIDMLNQVSEGANRLEPFKRALEAGATDEQAAMYALKSSIDFRMKGTKTGTGAALWAFLNPTLQAPVNTVKNYIRKPSLLAGTAVAIGALGEMQDAINSQFDPEWKSKLAGENAQGFPFVYGKEADGTLDRITIPVAPGQRPIKAMTDMVSDLMHGKTDEFTLTNNAARLIASVADASSMTGVSTDPKQIIHTIVPTVAKPLAEVASNKDAFGREIVPSYLDSRAAGYKKTRASFRDSYPGKIAMAISDYLYEEFGVDINPMNMLHLARQYSGGPGRVLLGSRMGDLGSSVKAVGDYLETGKEAKATEQVAKILSPLPVLGGLFGRVPGDIVETQTQEYQEAQEAKSDEETAKLVKSQTILDAVRAATKAKEAGNVEELAKAKEGIMSLLQEHPDWEDSIIRAIENSGKDWTATEHVIDTLGKKDGSRAKYVAQQLKRKKTNQERKSYLLGLYEKGLLDEDLIEQTLTLYDETP